MRLDLQRGVAHTLTVGVLVFTPSPVHARVSVILCLAGDRMSIAEQELFAGMMLEMVIAANVDHRRAFGLCRGITFAPMRKELRAQLKPLVEFPFYQPSGIWEVAVAGLRRHLIAAASINQPLTEILLPPDRKFVPDFSNSEPFVRVPCRHFKHGECADLRKMSFLFDDGEFHAQFHVIEAKRAWARSSGKVNGIVRWKDASPGKYGVQLHPGYGPPVEFKSRTGRVDFRRCAANTAEDIELVVMQVDRHRIVSLIRRTLRPQYRSRKQKQEKQRHS